MQIHQVLVINAVAADIIIPQAAERAAADGRGTLIVQRISVCTERAVVNRNGFAGCIRNGIRIRRIVRFREIKVRIIDGRGAGIAQTDPEAAAVDGQRAAVVQTVPLAVCAVLSAVNRQGALIDDRARASSGVVINNTARTAAVAEFQTGTRFHPQTISFGERQRIAVEAQTRAARDRDITRYRNIGSHITVTAQHIGG